jgi:sterol 24-C-methyltransferase
LSDTVTGHQREVIGYYRKLESRLTYRLVLGGTKHFGYYPEGSRHLSMATAMRLMEDKLGRTLALPAGSPVLDAGCGEGDVAIRLRDRFGLEVDGVDVLDFNLGRARRKAARLGPTDSPRFHCLDYADLPFPDQTFDGVYTMETLVHAFDHQQALRELRRVLKPGGKLVLFEYSVPPREQMTQVEREALDFVVEASAMRSLPLFVHGGFPAIVDRAGFVAVSTEDITERMTPMLRRLACICYLPYRLGRLLRARRTLLNCTAAVESYRHRAGWRYNVVTARRPTSLEAPSRIRSGDAGVDQEGRRDGATDIRPGALPFRAVGRRRAGGRGRHRR